MHSHRFMLLLNVKEVMTRSASPARLPGETSRTKGASTRIESMIRVFQALQGILIVDLFLFYRAATMSRLFQRSAVGTQGPGPIVRIGGTTPNILE